MLIDVRGAVARLAAPGVVVDVAHRLGLDLFVDARGGGALVGCSKIGKAGRQGTGTTDFSKTDSEEAAREPPPVPPFVLTQFTLKLMSIGKFQFL